jgi:hypothetical protein
MTWDNFNTIVILLVAASNVYIAYISHRTEKNTNSMKDALVASTAKASRAEGMAAGKKEEKEEEIIRNK